MKRISQALFVQRKLMKFYLVTKVFCWTLYLRAFLTFYNAYWNSSITQSIMCHDIVNSIKFLAVFNLKISHDIFIAYKTIVLTSAHEEHEYHCRRESMKMWRKTFKTIIRLIRMMIIMKHFLYDDDAPQLMLKNTCIVSHCLNIKRVSEGAGASDFCSFSW